MIFFLVYAVFVGLGYGLTYFLAIECAWSYFPEKKSVVSGIVLCCYSVGAVSAATYTAKIVNPDNEVASVEIQTGATVESFYPVDSDPVENLNEMFSKLSMIYIVILAFAMVLISRKPTGDDTPKLKL